MPVCPTSYGDSPYQSFSTFAGNPYFIDLDYLVEEGLITKAQIKKFPWGDNAEYIDYATVYGSRFQILRMAFNNSTYAETQEYAQFEKDNEYWLDDYSLYMAVKFKFDNQEWSKWDYDIKARQPESNKTDIKKSLKMILLSGNSVSSSSLSSGINYVFMQMKAA